MTVTPAPDDSPAAPSGGGAAGAGGIRLGLRANLGQFSLLVGVNALDPAERLDGPVLDVRQAAEYRAGHVPGARNLELGALGAAAPPIDAPLAVMCGHGERAATAASLLTRTGHPEVRIVTGGPAEWAAAQRRGLEVGR